MDQEFETRIFVFEAESSNELNDKIHEGTVDEIDFDYEIVNIAYAVCYNPITKKMIYSAILNIKANGFGR